MPTSTSGLVRRFAAAALLAGLVVAAGPVQADTPCTGIDWKTAQGAQAVAKATQCAQWALGKCKDPSAPGCGKVWPDAMTKYDKADANAKPLADRTKFVGSTLFQFTPKTGQTAVPASNPISRTGKKPALKLSTTGVTLAQTAPAAGAKNAASWKHFENEALTAAASWKPTAQVPTSAEYVRAGIKTGLTPIGADGDVTRACKDYVYRSFVFQEKWLDAVYASGKDQRAIVQNTIAAANWEPAWALRLIAKFPVKTWKYQKCPQKPGDTCFTPSSEGYNQTTYFGSGFYGPVPRNAFFASTGHFFPPAVVNLLPADLKGVVAAIKGNGTAYRIGPPDYKVSPDARNNLGDLCPEPRCKAFPTEMKWHKAMFDGTKNVSDGEFAEYGRRNANITYLIDAYRALLTSTACAMDFSTGTCGDFARQAKKLPELFKSANRHPIMLSRLSTENAERNSIGMNSLLVDPDNAAPLSPQATNEIIRQYVSNEPSKWLDAQWKQKPPAFNATTRRFDCSTKSGAELGACQIINTVLGEFEASKKGTPSCFDPANLACDWWPKLAIDSLVHANTYTDDKEDLYRDCAIFANILFKKGEAPPACKSCYCGTDCISPNDVDKKIDNVRNYLNGQAKKLKKIGVVSKNVYGKRLKKTDSTGSSDSFKGGYSYDFGYEVRLYQNKDKVVINEIDMIGGRIWGYFNANASAYGKGPWNILDAAFVAQAADDWDLAKKKSGWDAKASDPANLNAPLAASPTATVAGHLDVIGIELWSYPKSNSLASMNGLLSGNGAKLPPIGEGTAEPSLPKIKKPSGFDLAGIDDDITLFTFVFVIPGIEIPVSVDFSIGYTTGVKWNAGLTFQKAKGDRKDKKAWKNPELKAFGTLTPYAGAYLKASVGIGIPFIAEIGVDVQVTVIDVQVPLTAYAAADIAYHKNSDGKYRENADLDFSVGADLDLVLSTLGGKIQLFGELFGFTATLDIFEWSGFSKTIPLYSFKKKVAEVGFPQNLFETVHSMLEKTENY